MKAARILVLATAFAAGGAAAYFICAVQDQEKKKPEALLAKSTISTLSSEIRSLFGANTVSDRIAGRKAVPAAPALAFAATMAS
jgi:predicted naringenin-chalcone synthase